MRGGLSKKALVVWETWSLLLFVLLAVVFYYVLPYRSLVWYLLIWLTGFFAVLSDFLYLPLLYHRCGYQIDENAVQYDSGLLFQVEKTMPYRSVMHTAVFRSPVDLLLGTSSLVVSSMGGRLTIPFLPRDRAEELYSLVTAFTMEKSGNGE